MICVGFLYAHLPGVFPKRGRKMVKVFFFLMWQKAFTTVTSLYKADYQVQCL